MAAVRHSVQDHDVRVLVESDDHPAVAPAGRSVSLRVAIAVEAAGPT
jgi:hypothetical protein